MKKVSLAILCLLFVSCASTLRVQKLVVGGSVDAGNNIRQEQTEFTTDQQKIYAQAFFANVRKDSQVTAFWWDEGGQIHKEMVTVSPQRNVKFFWVERKNGWPAGTYRFTIEQGEQVLAEKEFVVKGL